MERLAGLKNSAPNCMVANDWNAGLMNTPEPEIHWQQKMQQVDMVPLFTGLFGETPPVSGKLDLDWAGETYGKTTRQLVLNLSVKGNALARRGDIERFNLAARLLTSRRARMPLQEGTKSGVRMRNNVPILMILAAVS